MGSGFSSNSKDNDKVTDQLTPERFHHYRQNKKDLEILKIKSSATKKILSDLDGTDEDGFPEDGTEDEEMGDYVKHSNKTFKSSYSTSPIRTVRTSPNSFRMSSGKDLDYPSPTRIHSPPISYANNFNRISPVGPKRYPSSESTESNTSFRRSTDSFIYTYPSPERRSQADRSINSPTSVDSRSPQRFWGRTSSVESDMTSENNYKRNSNEDHWYYPTGGRRSLTSPGLFARKYY